MNYTRISTPTTLPESELFGILGHFLLARSLQESIVALNRRVISMRLCSCLGRKHCHHRRNGKEIGKDALIVRCQRCRSPATGAVLCVKKLF